MRTDARCRTCHARIRWAVTEATGKRIPLDAIAVTAGNIWVVGYEAGIPIVRVAADPTEVPATEPLRFVSHFATCNDADAWRRR